MTDKGDFEAMDKGFTTRLADLLRQGVNFVVYALPGSEDVSVLVDDNTSAVISSRKFTVTDWHGNRYEIIDRECSPVASMPQYADDSRRPDRSRTTTSWEEYNRGLQQVIGQLRENQGKAVISRCVAIYDDRITYDTVASAIGEMFKAYSPTFRAVYFTPATGAWCVCSPELLLEVDKPTGSFRTIALAGTRPLPEEDSRRDSDGIQWDDKNIREHNFVVRHITSQLSRVTDTIRVAPAETLTTGKIQHLLTRIEGTLLLRDADAGDPPGGRAAISDTIERTLSLLHPTPAICGYPVDWAREAIERTELHDRECYGGYFSLEDDSSYIAHVNLRCFAFGPGNCCFWGGGGILADSDPQKEWDEATSKIHATLRYMGVRD